ncbi:hypothetical protein [Streptomyces chartreusis]
MWVIGQVDTVVKNFEEAKHLDERKVLQGGSDLRVARHVMCVNKKSTA